MIKTLPTSHERRKQRNIKNNVPNREIFGDDAET
jgi:hypothetical protein